jgi:drug/metabolite transporter (DMT)-like permease
MSKSTGKVYAELTTVAAIWGGVFLVVKHALVEMGPMKMGMTRFVLSALVALPLVAYLQPKSYRLGRTALVPVIVTGLQTFLYQFCFFEGMSRTSAINTSLIIAANPIMTAVLAGIFLREQLHFGQKFGIALSFAGELFVLSQGSIENVLHLRFNKGDLFLFVSITSWAINSLFMRSWAGRITPLALSAWASLIAAVCFLPLGWIEVPRGIPLQWSWPLAGAMFYIVMLSTVLAGIWWYGGVMAVGPSRSAIFSNLCPVFTLLFSLLFGLPIFLNQVFGAVLVVCGVYLTTRKWEAAPTGAEA